MLTFILSVISLIALSVGGYYAFNKFFDWKAIIGGVVGYLSTIAIMFVIAGSFLGGMGFDTYDIKTTTDFTKAMANDHSSITIIHNKVPYVFDQYNAVNNFDAITNIVVAEKKNVYGIVLETAVQVLTPKYQAQ